MEKPDKIPSESYDFKQLQQKWSPQWAQAGLDRTHEDPSRPKLYCLDFFPYPSGSGLSVGHLRNYVPTDVISRMYRARGYNVLHPMGWDAFGLPAENYAIKMGIHPAETTRQNVANYKRQLSLVENWYDWEKEVNSSTPDYYHWTQWFFLLLFNRDLAYRARAQQFWCPECQTILANEQVEQGKCWRHTETDVTKKDLTQWYFRITKYADALIDDLATIDWPENIKKMQVNWIGRSQGTEITFEARTAQDEAVDLTAFTTRIDTIFGTTFIVMAPEHPLVAKLTHPEKKAEVEAYVKEAGTKTDVQRMTAERDKTGVALGTHAVHPFTGEQLPIWVADYVVWGYGTGVVECVPAHDARDHAFAKKYGITIREVIGPADGSKYEGECFEDRGRLVNSQDYTGLTSEEAIEKLTAALEKRGRGRRQVNYKIRDWLISRQRYWGAPIPIIHCEKCGPVGVPEADLPVRLPEIQEFRPAGTGRSPLAKVEEWVRTTCPKCGGPGERETDTMDGFACSSWYFLRFPNPRHEKGPFVPEKVDYWLPVDLYVGGAEHAVMHLLYARFWTKVMNDAGLLKFREPFKTLKNQGMMLAPTADGKFEKMSKSKGNVVTPDEVVEKYGADTCRAYILFQGEFEADVVWSDDAIMGVFRFIHRVWTLVLERGPLAGEGPSPADRTVKDLRFWIHKTIKKVTQDIEGFDFNTSVAALMEFTNKLNSQANEPGLRHHPVWSEAMVALMQLLAPITPFLAEELWSRHGHHAVKGTIHQQPWPTWDETALVRDEIEYPVQINGKIRDKVTVPADIGEEDLKQLVLARELVVPWTEGKTVQKIIVVPRKLISLVVK